MQLVHECLNKIVIANIKKILNNNNNNENPFRKMVFSVVEFFIKLGNFSNTFSTLLYLAGVQKILFTFFLSRLNRQTDDFH